MPASSLRLFHRLQLAAHRVRKTADRAVSEASGLSTAQCAMLVLVASGQAVTQKDVADALGLNESAVTATVKRLLAADYLVRERDPRDGRSWKLTLSEAGQSALEAAAAPFAQINADLDSQLSEAEQEALAAALDRISSVFASR